MPETTPNLEIKKPKGNKNVSRDSFNENWDIIDQNAAKKADLDTHLANEENPHNVTAEQIGAAKQTDFATHLAEDATETQKGHIELATSTETTAGTDKTKAVHPAGLKEQLDKKSDTGHVHSNATTSTAGFMSTTDKSKLEGIEDNATADQTASEILSLLKTVDSNSSGLNADTLDGVHASGFVKTSNGIQLRISGTSLQYYYGGAWKDVGVVATQPRVVSLIKSAPNPNTWYTVLSVRIRRNYE